MYKLKEIADKVYYVGVNDRQKALFENMWPLPYGVSYNSYLIVDEKTVLVDTVDVCYSDIFLKKIADALDGRPLDFLIVNHMEPDHAGSIRLLRQQYPDVQIIGNKQTFGREQDFVSRIVSDHHFRPVHHRSHIERQLVTAHTQGVSFLHFIQSRRDTVIPIQHALWCIL